MTPTPVLEAVPLTFESDDVIRVAGTRVPLDTIVDAFESGATPEEISSDYPVLQLGDVYSVLTYYLRHREEVLAYLERRKAVRDEIRRSNETGSSFADLRRRLAARRQRH